MGHTRRNNRGFSLIELMVVVVIIGILAAIALPAYQNYVVSTRRAAASACLMEMSQFMERYYTTNLTYVGAALPDLTCEADIAQFYSLDLAAAATASAYSLVADAQGAQETRDTECINLTINQAGTRSATGPGGASCW